MNYGILSYLYDLTHGEDEDICPVCRCFDCECEEVEEERLTECMPDPLRGWA